MELLVEEKKRIKVATAERNGCPEDERQRQGERDGRRGPGVQRRRHFLVDRQNGSLPVAFLVLHGLHPPLSGVGRAGLHVHRQPTRI